MKRILMIFFCFSLIICGCTTGTLNLPSSFKIENDVLTWEINNGSLTYRIELENINTNVVIKRIVTNGINLNDLNIPEGDYMIKLQVIKGDKESEFTESIFYHQKDNFVVNKILGDMLISDMYLKWMGRTLYQEATKENTIFHTASGFELFFYGTSVSAVLTSTNTLSVGHRPYFVVVIDDDFENINTVCLSKPLTEINLIADLPEGEHKLTFYKRSEAIDSHIGLKELTTDGKFISKIIHKERRIEVIAASSSTGYGNMSNDTKTTANSDGLKAFAFLASQALEAEISIYSASGWGLKFSRWTSPQTLNMFDAYKKVEMFSNVDWNPSDFVPDVIIINLGTNDWSYINMTDNNFEKNERLNAFKNQYISFIQYLRTLYQNSEIIILYGIMSETSIYEATIEIFNQVYLTDKKVHILKAIGDGAGYNSHPSLASHEAISKVVINKIKEITKWS